MNWKVVLKKLEDNGQWDEAIEFMQQVIRNNPNDMDAYLFINFFLVELMIERDHEKSKEQYYWDLAKHYFRESYAKFSDNPEYLYITAKTAVMGEWLFGIEQEDYEQMIEEAKRLDPENLLYKENYYWDLYKKNSQNSEVINYCKLVLGPDSPIRKQLKYKGSVGEYLIGLKESWCERVLRSSNKSAES